jgi:hypothetical protein
MGVVMINRARGRCDTSFEYCGVVDSGIEGDPGSGDEDEVLLWRALMGPF